MEEYFAQGIDEYGRIFLNDDVRGRTILGANSNVAVHSIGTVVFLQRMDSEDIPQQHFVKTIDNLGNIELPAELMEKLKWKTGDEISVFYADAKTIVLHLDKDN